MKKRFYPLLFSLFITSFLGATAQTYNANDIARLKEFMEQSSGGNRNIDILLKDKEENAPATLSADGSNWVSLISSYVTWSGDRLKSIDAKYMGLNGKLDLSGCTSLTDVYLRNNNMTSVNLKGCSNLQMLYVCLNQIETLNIEDCYNIKEIAASSNKYTTFDISNRKKLTKLYIPNNKLTSVNVKGCSELKTLTFTKGSVQSVDLSDCVNLVLFECYGNNIISLDLSKSPKLETLTINNGTFTNPLTSLNVSGCQKLSSYDFSSCTNLQSLNVTNCGLSTISLSKYGKLTKLEAGGQQLAVEEVEAINGKVNVTVLSYAGIIVTPSDNGTETGGVITWDAPSDRGTYSYDFTSTLPAGVTGTPFGGKVSVPWRNSNPVSNIEINGASLQIYSSNGTLYIQSGVPQAIRVYTLTGQIIKQSAAVTDASFVLPKGIYIVQSGKDIQKVIVR